MALETGIGRHRPALTVMTWLRLARVSQKIEHVLTDHVREWNLSLAQFDVLAHVGAAEGLSQQELADALLVTKGNVCQLLARMEADGLIERRQEGRTNRLYLTDRGHSHYADIVPAHEAIVAEQFDALSPEETVQLHELLRKLDRALG